ncbi:MAG: Hsp20/alpha crystallin family protein [Planctomycetes bacterium]|nr:Hsp20/alpha crystallin family protein [Planctomycetota bacterium]
MANTSLVKQEQCSDVAIPERTRGGVSFTPRCDILEMADELLLYADMPGVRPDDLDVQFENGGLTIYGKCSERQEGFNYLLNEFAVGHFYRTFAISETVDAAKINAELKHGVLTVHLPKTESARPKRIAVKANQAPVPRAERTPPAEFRVARARHVQCRPGPELSLTASPRPGLRLIEAGRRVASVGWPFAPRRLGGMTR